MGIIWFAGDGHVGENAETVMPHGGEIQLNFGSPCEIKCIKLH